MTLRELVDAVIASTCETARVPPDYRDRLTKDWAVRDTADRFVTVLLDSVSELRTEDELDV